MKTHSLSPTTNHKGFPNSSVRTDSRTPRVCRLPETAPVRGRTVCMHNEELLLFDWLSFFFFFVVSAACESPKCTIRNGTLCWTPWIMEWTKMDKTFTCSSTAHRPSNFMKWLIMALEFTKIRRIFCWATRCRWRRTSSLGRSRKRCENLVKLWLWWQKLGPCAERWMHLQKSWKTIIVLFFPFLKGAENSFMCFCRHSDLFLAMSYNTLHSHENQKKKQQCKQ